MIDYVYEVRGTDDPIDGDKVRFRTKDEAMAYYEESKPNHPEAAVYIIEYEFDDFEGADNMTSIPEQRTVVQIAGPDVETINTPDGFPDSCAGDNSDNYDDNGMFRLPKYDDDLDDDDDITEEDTDGGLVDVEDIPVDESLSEDVKEGTDQYVKLVNDSASKYHPNKAYDLNDIKHLFKDCDTTKKRFSEKEINLIAKFDNHCKVIRESDKGMLVTVPCYYRDPKDRAKILDTPKYIEVWAPKSNTKPITESFEDDDDIETEAFAEELFSALNDKRDERAFPEGDLDLDAPHEDVPVVDCKVNPAITHAEDEKPLVEDVDRADEFYDALEDNAPAQMYVAREIVYSLVDDEASAQKLAAWGEGLEFDEQLALDSLIADALEGANEHMAMMDYLNDKSLPVNLSDDLDEEGRQNMDALLASCKTEQEKLDLLFQAINFLVLDGYLY